MGNSSSEVAQLREQNKMLSDVIRNGQKIQEQQQARLEQCIKMMDKHINMVNDIVTKLYSDRSFTEPHGGPSSNGNGGERRTTGKY